MQSKLYKNADHSIFWCFAFTFLVLFFCLACGQPNPKPITTPNTRTTEDCSDPTAIKKIQDSLTPRIILEMTEEEFKEFMADTPLQGLQSYNLDTTYNEHCLLSINVNAEWSAAYVQGFSRYRCFDKHTGNRLFIKDLIKEDSLASLVKQLYETAEVTARSRREEVVADRETVNDTGNYDEYIKSSLENISAQSLENFYISKDGITFTHEHSFGHAFWSIEPAPVTLTLSSDELQGYLKPGGPMSFWLKK